MPSLRHLLVRRRPLVQTSPLHHLLVVPILLAVATGVILFLRSDTNIAMLFSQCSARSRLHSLSRIPLLGTPACFLISFFQEALASSRSAAAMAAVLSFVAGLLTVSTVESARICNAPNILIAYPTGPWLVFNLLGGALVWELLIIPAFLHRTQQLHAAAAAAADAEDGPVAEPEPVSTGRHLGAVAEVIAIPTAVALGFVAPSLGMLASDHPIAIAVWLFFPVYVSVVRKLVRRALALLLRFRATLHLESHRPSVLAMYAVPVLCSAASHVFLLWSLIFRADDRREMTRSTVRFIEIDVAFIAATVLYWLVVEAGWDVAGVVVGVGAVLGPGAGICVGWLYRERRFGFVFDEAEGNQDVGDEDEDATVVGEDSPLLP